MEFCQTGTETTKITASIICDNMTELHMKESSNMCPQMLFYSTNTWCHHIRRKGLRFPRKSTRLLPQTAKQRVKKTW